MARRKKKSGFFSWIVIFLIFIGLFGNKDNTDTPNKSDVQPTQQIVATTAIPTATVKPTKAPTNSPTEVPAKQPTEAPTVAPTEKPLEILLKYPELGQYGVYYTFNANVAKAEESDKHTVIQCFVPPGTYTVTNEGQTPWDYVYIYSKETVITSAGWEEPADSMVSPQLKLGDSCEITIKEGYYIKLLQNSVFRLVKKAEAPAVSTSEEHSSSDLIAKQQYEPLQSGDSGASVLEMKERLKALGYYGADAEFSDRYNDSHVERVKLFQERNGLPQTGVADVETLIRLYSDEAIPKNSSFEIHFLDVGQGDAALVFCDNKTMLIDGGESNDSSFVYAYLKQHNVSQLDYIVATHGHEDHIGGLSGALNFATVDTAYCSVSNYDSDAFSDFVKYLNKQNVSITVPSAGDTFTLGSATVQVLAPISYSDDHNNNSIVLRIVYGGTSFLFAGDAEREEEQSILNAGYNLRSTVLKVGHHGSDSSTTYPFLREIMPEYAVISVGKGNSYGHPTDDTLSRLRDADVKVFRTDIQGTIICTSNGKTVSFVTERNQNADTLNVATPTVKPRQTEKPASKANETTHSYVLNSNTGKFHYPSCSSVKRMSEKNKVYFTGTREEVISRGYSPCGNCHP